ncbi:MAG: DUF3267 domain-containing protein [Clostridia bacterium]
MRLHYKKTYDNNPDSLPHGEHKPNAVALKESKNNKKLSILSNLGCVFIIAILGGLGLVRYWNHIQIFPIILGVYASIMTLIPHELLHAICFKEDVYIYANRKQGMLFLVGAETMSKQRFIFMSLLPNIIFGFIPYIISMIFPNLIFLMTFSAFCIGLGFGDYYNAYKAITEMPKGARRYSYKCEAFWYLPSGAEE